MLQELKIVDSEKYENRTHLLGVKIRIQFHSFAYEHPSFPNTVD
jgi:hypothetical protein